MIKTIIETVGCLDYEDTTTHDPPLVSSNHVHTKKGKETVLYTKLRLAKQRGIRGARGWRRRK